MRLWCALLSGTVILLGSGATFARESAPVSKVYTRQHDLLVDAIRQGSAAGVMKGEVAAIFAAQFQTQGALLVRARSIHSWPQKGCKRIEVVYTQRDIDTPKGRTEGTFTQQLNYCLDGLPPETTAGEAVKGQKVR